jgi:hypothetical protein
MIQPKNPLEDSLSKLDLKGLLVLNGIITQQALKYILDAEAVSNQYKPKLVKPDKRIIT